MTELLLKLLLAHFIADFIFQPNKWVKDKEENKIRSKSLYLHILIHAIALFICLFPHINYWPAILTLLTSHYLIDLLKLYLDKRIDNRLLFFADQIAHLSIIALVSHYYIPFQIDLKTLITPQNLLFVLALLACTSVSSVLMKLFLSRWQDELEEENCKTENSTMTLTNAGIYIGILERLFIFFFVVSQHYSGIGFLLAAKSVFRFGDLSNAKDRKLTEYILIGTLLSFALAIISAEIYLYLKATL